MMNRLILANIQNDKKNLDDIVPQSVIEDSSKYIKSSSHILQIFDALYEETEDKTVEIPLAATTNKIYGILFHKNKNTAIKFTRPEIKKQIEDKLGATNIIYKPNDHDNKYYIVGYHSRQDVCM